MTHISVSLLSHQSTLLPPNLLNRILHSMLPLTGWTQPCSSSLPGVLSVEIRCICLHCLQPQPMQPAYYLLSAGLAVICPASDMISYSERYGGGLYHSMATRVRNDSQVPRPPRKDFYKLMNRDHIVLRYAIRLVATTGYSLSETDRLAACNSCG